MRYIKYGLLLFFLSWIRTNGQETRAAGMITGKIRGIDDHLPVEGAVIEIKHTGTKAVSDKEGNYTITFKSITDTLLISHISFNNKQVPVNINHGGTLLIELEKRTKDLAAVEVIVSTGLQSLPKERSTGSFTVVDNKLFNEQVGVNVLSRLKYISNGVTSVSDRIGIFGKDQLLIRGLSTLTFSIQKPLIILDNFEYQGSIDNINPNDVDNVTFLKDAAAGSIWGAKAANGVIVITTKKGHYNQRAKIEFNANVSVVGKPDLYSLKNIAATDLIDVEQFLFQQNYRFADTSSGAHVPFSPVYEILFKEKNGQISAAQAKEQIDALRSADVRKDFTRYFYQQAVNQQYSINLSGGSNNIAWILSGGVDKDINELHAPYNRVNARFENIYQVTKNLSLTTSLYYTQSTSKTGRPSYGSINTATGRIPVYSQFADAGGTPLPLYNNYRQGFIDTLGAGKLLDWKYYPLEDYKHVLDKITLQDINAVVGLNYKIMPAFNLDVKYRYEKQLSVDRTLYDQQSYYTRNLINSYSQVDNATGIVSYFIPKGDIQDLNNNSVTANNIRGQLNFNKSWDKHNAVLIAGSEFSETVNEGNSYRTYGYHDDILTYTNVDYANEYPLLIQGSNFIPNPANFSKTNTRFASFYANGVYIYDNKYTLSGSVRRDASNLFGVNINDKWKPLWSLGMAWNISKENFYKADFLPELKLRVTYGHQGNIDPSKVAVTTFQYLSTNPFTQTPYGQVKNFINPDLKWEQVAMLNTALDFASKNHRISGSIEYYKKDMTDLYGPTTIDLTAGLGTSTITKNIGVLKGHGLDIELNTLNINRAVKWYTDFIFNMYKDKVTKFYDPASFKVSDLVGSGSAIEGYPSFYLAVYKWAGLDPVNGDPRGYLNGKVSKDWEAITGGVSTLSDIQFVGPLLPTAFGSIGNTLTFKKFSVSARVTYKFGYYFLRESVNYTNLVSTLDGHADYSLRWLKPGDEAVTNVPSFTYPVNSARDNFYRNSEVLATKGDHIRLQYINIGYDISRSNLQKLPFENIHLYVVLNDLGIIWRANKYHLDPDYTSIVPAKSIALGLKVSF